MNTPASEATLSKRIAAELPYLRRYARALTGAQDVGDDFAVAALESILSDRSAFVGPMSVKVGLFNVFHQIWSQTTVSDLKTLATEPAANGRAHLAKLLPNSREALLLRTIEEFSLSEIAAILSVEQADVQRLLTVARDDLQSATHGRILVIEDEPVIAADISAIVEALGHTVTAIARTRADAVKLGTDPVPDLMLVDIQLADNSSGVDAANELLALIGPIPVIFITAFPERLLTGNKPEPTFLISKPYREEQVTAAVSQAMFFAARATHRLG